MRRPAPAGLELRREPLLVSGALWVGVQGLVCLSALPSAGRPGLALLSSLGAAALLAALLLVPRWHRRNPLGEDLPLAPAVAAAVLLPVAVLVNAHATAAGALLSDQPTATGLLSPALALLVLRGRRGCAAACGVAVLAVLVGLRVRAGESPLWAPETALLVGPVGVWWVWGLVAERLRRTTHIELLRSDGAYAQARERRRRTRERAEAHGRRRALLEESAVPLLQVVAAADGSLDDAVRARLTAVEADLRAELRGRDLLDADVRAGAATARSRGVRVDVVDHAPPGADLELLAPLRALVAAALLACADGEVTARRPPHEAVLTLVHVGSEDSVRAVHAAVREHAERLQRSAPVGVDVSADEDAVVVEVSR